MKKSRSSRQCVQEQFGQKMSKWSMPFKLKSNCKLQLRISEGLASEPVVHKWHRYAVVNFTKVRIDELEEIGKLYNERGIDDTYINETREIFKLKLAWLTCFDAPQEADVNDEFGQLKASDEFSNFTIEEWNSLLHDDDPPFLQGSFLRALEDTDCVSLQKGWQARFLIARNEDGLLVGGVPMYTKLHNDGEFCDEISWMSLACELDVDHVPRIFVGVPFTPHCGRRLLTSPLLDEEEEVVVKAHLAKALEQISKSVNSSVNVGFAGADEVSYLAREGFLQRKAYQLWWRNKSYSSFDDYLVALRADRRKNILKDRRTVSMLPVEIEVIDGQTDPEKITEDLMSNVFEVIYRTTQVRHGFEDYALSEEFFRKLAREIKQHILLILVYQEGVLIAGSICFTNRRRIYGRYWGHNTNDDLRCVHFECCYYKLIELAIEGKYEIVEPGNGGSEIFRIQYRSGFEPAETHSYHFIPNVDLREEIKRLPFEDNLSQFIEGMRSPYKST